MSMRTETILVRVSPEEKQCFQNAASICGISLSAWVRERLRTASRKDLEDSGISAEFIVLPTQNT